MAIRSSVHLYHICSAVCSAFICFPPAKQLFYLYPRFYNCSVPAAFSADLPQLTQLCEGSKPQLTSDRRVEQLFSIRGEKFVSFVKSEHFVDGTLLLVYAHSYVLAIFGAPQTYKRLQICLF